MRGKTEGTKMDALSRAMSKQIIKKQLNLKETTIEVIDKNVTHSK